MDTKNSADFEAGQVPVLDRHPRDLSLREFMCNFTKKWKYAPAEVFPYMIPTYRYVVMKGKPHYEEYCKNLLLQDKPGCTLDTVGKAFSSCEEELKDFVENSEFCPNLVKVEFDESQKISVDPNQAEDPFIAGDALYVEPEGKPERAPKDEVMHLYDLGHDNDSHDGDEIDNDFYDNPDPNYCDDVVKKKEYEDHDWFEDRNNLSNITDEKIE